VSDEILYDARDHAARITLNRPQKRNALTQAGLDALAARIDQASADDAVWVVAIQARGTDFCIGQDIEDLDRNDRKGDFFAPVLRSLDRTMKPVIMAVNGIAAGGGMSLALAGDLVVAAESTRFTMAYSKIAASPDGSSSYFLPRMIGLRRALELHYTNRVLSAREAMEWGLVNRVHPDAEFSGAVGALARELAQGPTQAFGRAKLLFHQSTQESLETQMELEAQAIAASGHTEDFRNGVVAFAKKQPVTFSGR